MYILGISCYYHDAAAALIKDGIVLAAAEEERFTRRKHDSSFPLNAINYCLRSQGISMNEITYIAFYEKPLLKFERLLSQHIQMFPRSFKTFVSSLPGWINEKLRLPKTLRRQLGYKGPILFIHHHMAHAASSFLVSPFQKAAVVTMDGVGEWTTTTYGRGEGNHLHLSKEIRFPHSIGLLYSTITGYLGFSVNNSEYKVMGLSPYGVMQRGNNEYYHKLKKVIDIKPDGSYRLDMRYFTYHYGDRMPSAALCELLDGPVRRPEEAITQRHQDIAAALQMITEEVMAAVLQHAYEQSGCENLVLGGGVALNSVYNGKILSSTPFKRVWIHPNATDGGNSIGAAIYAYNAVLGYPRRYVLQDAYLGPAYSRREIKDFLDNSGVRYSEFRSEDECVSATARLIAGDLVVGWFQGRMEWGPRALGARSILSNPCNPHMQEILNEKVKHREKFRPFAPVVCEDDALKYFDCDVPIPEPTDFMLMVYPVREQWRSVIPAVTHVDGSGRLQTIRRHQNPSYYDLIKEFGRITGVPILINTSFNIRGEPIVCSPYDAYKCMMGTGIDCLVMERFLIYRKDNPQHAWDSESLAKD